MKSSLPIGTMVLLFPCQQQRTINDIVMGDTGCGIPYHIYAGTAVMLLHFI
jgi:hypothetical protein